MFSVNGACLGVGVVKRKQDMVTPSLARLKEGDACFARYQASNPSVGLDTANVYFKGAITRVNKDGTYSIRARSIAAPPCHA